MSLLLFHSTHAHAARLVRRHCLCPKPVCKQWRWSIVAMATARRWSRCTSGIYRMSADSVAVSALGPCHCWFLGLLMTHTFTSYILWFSQALAAARLIIIIGAKRREHIPPTLRQLLWLPVRRRVEFKTASLVYQEDLSLSSKVPGYHIHLASESSARSLRSSLGRKCSCSQSFWWPMFCCSWTTYLEQLTCQSARQGSQLHRIQITTENIHVSDGLRCIVAFLIIAPYKYSYLLIYLLAYLLTYLLIYLFIYLLIYLLIY